MSGLIKKLQDPQLGEYYRATCDNCGKIFESKSSKQILFNIIQHRASHNGHS